MCLLYLYLSLLDVCIQGTAGSQGSVGLPGLIGPRGNRGESGGDGAAGIKGTKVRYIVYSEKILSIVVVVVFLHHQCTYRLSISQFYLQKINYFIYIFILFIVCR